MVRQASAGIYSWLPLGLNVLQKIETIVREEQDRSGAIEMLMPTLQQADLWRESGRYDAYGPEMLRFRDRHEREMLYGPTNEELITQIFRDAVRSYRDLPRNLYHIQWKFRDEVRPRFGVMHPVKSRSAIRRAFAEFGVRSFALDSEEELKKIAEETGGCRDLTLWVRVAVSAKNSKIPLERKYGVAGAKAVRLLGKARQAAKTLGVTFHALGARQTRR